MVCWGDGVGVWMWVCGCGCDVSGCGCGVWQGRSDELKAEFEALQSSSEYQRMQGQRQGLPAYGLRESIVQTIGEHQVVVIEGETGSGKTTQVSMSSPFSVESDRMMQDVDFWFCGDGSGELYFLMGVYHVVRCVLIEAGTAISAGLVSAGGQRRRHQHHLHT